MPRSCSEMLSLGISSTSDCGIKLGQWAEHALKDPLGMCCCRINFTTQQYLRLMGQGRVSSTVASLEGAFRTSWNKQGSLFVSRFLLEPFVSVEELVAQDLHCGHPATPATVAARTQIAENMLSGSCSKAARRGIGPFHHWRDRWPRSDVACHGNVLHLYQQASHLVSIVRSAPVAARVSWGKRSGNDVPLAVSKLS